MTARFAEFWHLLAARLALLAGRAERARTALKAALRRNPNRFVSHFLLARLYWRGRSAVKAKREFDLAWQIDPERFERAYGRLRVRHEGVPELFAAPGGGRDVPVTVRKGSRRRYGDFRGEAEWRRFRDLPPITRDDITSIDWGRIQEELARDQDGPA